MVEFLHRLKLLIQTLAPVPGEAVLIGLGLACYLATCLIARRPLAWPWALLPGLLLGLAVEGLEIWGHYRLAGLLEAGPRGVLEILLRHARDVAVMNAVPVVVVLAAVLAARARPG